jgi:hypothetical protein
MDRLNAAPGQPLTDNGATLADYASVVTKWGVVPMLATINPNGFTDVTPDNLNTPPALGVLISAAHRLIVGEYNLDLTASDAVVTACGLLAQNIPLYVGGFVDSAVENFTAGSAPVSAPNESDPNGGGHAMAIVGYKTLTAEEAEPWGLEAGDVLFEVLSSWGSGYGDAGHFWGTKAWFGSLWDCWPWPVREVDS